MNSLPPYNGAATVHRIVLSDPGFFIYPSPITPSRVRTGAPPCTIFSPQGIQSNAKTPAVQEWNLTVEQQLSHNTSLRVAYVGSFGVHELLSIDPNTHPRADLRDHHVHLRRHATGSCNKWPTVPQGTRSTFPGLEQPGPNPSLSGGFFWLTEGNSSYNALEVDVTHRISKGLEFRGNYTWSKNLDINSGLTGAQANNQAQMVLDRNDLRQDWGPSALNPASQASISASYELPFGHGQRWLNDVSRVESKFVSGWQVNGIGTFLSGFPFTPLIGSNRSGDGDTRNPDRPSINSVLHRADCHGKSEPMVQSGRVHLADAGTYGNLGRGTLTGRASRMSIFRYSRTPASRKKRTCSFARSYSTS